jgi:hypothetical protein
MRRGRIGADGIEYEERYLWDRADFRRILQRVAGRVANGNAPL